MDVQITISEKAKAFLLGIFAQLPQVQEGEVGQLPEDIDEAGRLSLAIEALSERAEFGFLQFAIAKLDLHDGDHIAIRTHLVLSDEQRERVMRQATQWFMPYPVIILDAGTEIAVEKSQ